MLAAIYSQALFIVADVGYVRGAGVILAFVRTFLGRKRFVAFRMGWVEAVCTVEPLLLLAVTYHVQSGAVPASSATFGRIDVPHGAHVTRKAPEDEDGAIHWSTIRRGNARPPLASAAS